MSITVIYTSIDHCRTRRSFKTIEGARKFAQARVGEGPEIGLGYAVSGDGIGKIQVSGVTLTDLFPSTRMETDSEREQREWAENRAARRIAEGYDDGMVDEQADAYPDQDMRYSPEGFGGRIDHNTPAGRRGYVPEIMTPREKLDVIRELPIIGEDGRLKVYRWYPSEGRVQVDLETGAIDL